MKERKIKYNNIKETITENNKGLRNKIKEKEKNNEEYINKRKQKETK